ncbi:Gag-Pol polyprotein [Vulpes lagopus]
MVQSRDETPTMYLNRLRGANSVFGFRSGSPGGGDCAGNPILFPSWRQTFGKKKAEEGPQTSISDLVKMAFKVFNTWGEAAEQNGQAGLQQKVQLQTQALVAALQPASSGGQRKGGNSRAPPGASCFQCRTEGHCARHCPDPKEPTGPCPQCKMMGHCKSDCPRLGASSAPPRGGDPETVSPASQLLGVEDGSRRPDSDTPLTHAEPRGTLQVAGKPVSFLLDTGATYSVLPSYSGPRQPSPVMVMGTDGTSSSPRSAPPLTCSLDESSLLFTLYHSLLPGAASWKGHSP